MISSKYLVLIAALFFADICQGSKGVKKGKGAKGDKNSLTNATSFSCQCQDSEILCGYV